MHRFDPESSRCSAADIRLTLGYGMQGLPIAWSPFARGRSANLILAGMAGCGKTVAATHWSMQLLAAGCQVVYLARTYSSPDPLERAARVRSYGAECLRPTDVHDTWFPTAALTLIDAHEDQWGGGELGNTAQAAWTTALLWQLHRAVQGSDSWSRMPTVVVLDHEVCLPRPGVMPEYITKERAHAGLRAFWAHDPHIVLMRRGFPTEPCQWLDQGRAVPASSQWCLDRLTRGGIIVWSRSDEMLHGSIQLERSRDGLALLWALQR